MAKATGGTKRWACRSVSNEKTSSAWPRGGVKAFGRIDILVNNAAVFSKHQLKPFEQISVDEWRKVMDVNIMGVGCARATCPHMRKAGDGASSTPSPRARR